MAIGIGVTAAIIGATACTDVTFGVCGAIIIGAAVAGAAVAGGAAAGLVTYNLSAGEKTAEGRLSATALGAVAGGVGGVAGQPLLVF
ncbi:hypothetical protein [Salinibacterium sp. PAMC 21357]|uniref:hypothetical protein n=1 Tax=Salinibacterium sp. PAMC 21357 TaxID=1112215 RepID=UPI0002898F06|nr:hypothetical protein [Salinibacterium sp. PAMC 21357]